MTHLKDKWRPKGTLFKYTFDCLKYLFKKRGVVSGFWQQRFERLLRTAIPLCCVYCFLLKKLRLQKRHPMDELPLYFFFFFFGGGGAREYKTGTISGGGQCMCFFFFNLVHPLPGFRVFCPITSWRPCTKHDTAKWGKTNRIGVQEKCIKVKGKSCDYF